MLTYCGLLSRHPFFYLFGEIIYYGLILVAIAVSLTMIRQKLFALGYAKRRVTFFIWFCASVTFPAGYLGSRAASMFYHPFSQWSMDFFIENILSGNHHTFHASLILPILLLSVCIILLRFHYFEVMDAIFLALPLAHAIGRVGCLVVGCCWGRYISLKAFGIHLRFANPIPLYAVIINGIIYLFLVRLYEKIYSDPDIRQRYRGAVLGVYLVLYGSVRLILELFRKEKRIYLGLTQAQLTMIIFICIGVLVFFIIAWMNHRRGDTHRHPTTDAELTLKHLFSLAGFVVTCLLLLFLFYYATRTRNAFPWPFQGAVSVGDAYMKIVYYLPVIFLPILSLYWLGKRNVHSGDVLNGPQLSIVFAMAMFISLYYSVDLMILRKPELKGLAYWPPVAILSVMNAFSEEIVFRLTAFSLFRRAGYMALTSNMLQSLLYSLVHFLIAGMIFGVMAFFYGLLLGRLYEKNRSIRLCIVCHFIIDIGCIGLPLLRA